ncbi:hypothetical protein HNV10_13705 [Winogradskyella litoriviva]|uniref:Uncharacterized protein n=1 Tax=Winogradskyella litoriviva TaxID=1220182 RepID=A0ABX2E7N6_9FLAO|nr:hypothetical protein [Winogradskyella litoriviva]NRD24309.1 hypothetical protein [Winogradskyella litoriviva]
MKISLLKTLCIILLSSLFLAASCFSDNDNENDDLDCENEENLALPADDMTELWIANITRATISDRLAITDGRKSPIHGNEIYRNNLGLENNMSIFSISGGSYNTDGTYPKTTDNAYTAYSLYDLERNNITISFVFCDESIANAELMVNEPIFFDNQSWILPYENNSIRIIEQGSLTITAKSERLQDEIPPLGKDINNNALETFRFNSEDMTYSYDCVEYTNHELNALKYGPNAVSDNVLYPIDITHSELTEMLGTENNVFPIKIIETALVQDGVRIEPVAQPPNF